MLDNKQNVRRVSNPKRVIRLAGCQDTQKYLKGRDPNIPLSSAKPSIMRIKRKHFSKTQKENTRLNTSPHQRKSRAVFVEKLKTDSCQDDNSLQKYISTGESPEISPRIMKSARKSAESYQATNFLQTTSETISVRHKKQQFDRLLQITAKCVDYYNQFTSEKSKELTVIDHAFSKMSDSLDHAFEQLLRQIRQKQLEIRKYLSSKHQSFIEIKQKQEISLRDSLQHIKEMHLSKILGQYPELIDGSCSSELLGKYSFDKTRKRQYKTEQNQKYGNATIGFVNIINVSSFSVKQDELSRQLNSFGETLNQFYSSMEEIEQLNFKASVEETISFANSMISEEIRTIVEQKTYPRNVCIDNSCSLSFGLEQDRISRVSSKTELFPDSTHQLLKQIEVVQDLRKNNISRYEKLLLT